MNVGLVLVNRFVFFVSLVLSLFSLFLMLGVEDFTFFSKKDLCFLFREVCEGAQWP